MKKSIILAILSIGMLFSFSSTGYAEEDIRINEEEITDSVVRLSDLPDSAREHFIEKGFDENSEIYKSVVEQPSDFLRSYGSPRSANALVMYASSRKINNTTGYTAYTVISSNSPMYKINATVNFGNKAHTANVNLPGSYDYNGGLYIFFDGRKQYRNIRAYAQVYNTFGWGTVNKPAGGLTLGN